MNKWFRMWTSAMAYKVTAAIVLLAAVSLQGQQPAQPAPEQREGFRFKTGVELVNVTATVTDVSGRFVSGLTKDDFKVYEDDVLQAVSHFGASRVPVSLGIVLDASGSMDGEKIRAARSALEQFLDQLSDPQDEFFLYRFSEDPILLQGWTSDRQVLSRALARISPNGGTALFDAVARAVPLAATGRNPKKALVVISDGNDTSSHIRVEELRRLIRETEVLVYAIGIDGQSESSFTPPPQRPQPPAPRFPVPIPTPQPIPIPVPQPFPRRPGGLQLSPQWQWPLPKLPSGRTSASTDRVNVTALRDITDDSGGRTEIVRDARDLHPATSSIADELSKQYYLGYPASGKKDGRWHAIRVEVLRGNYRVRARRGYVAS
jgi:VWFA-related protein